MESTLKKKESLDILGTKLIDIVSSLKCPICLDIIDNAREMPCRHVFCFNCLETYKKGKDVYFCPVCKKEVRKRKYLSHDAGLDKYCVFLRKFCDDYKNLYGEDVLTHLAILHPAHNANMNNAVSSDAVTSEENIIPCTLFEQGNEKAGNNRRKNVSKNIKTTSRKEKESCVKTFKSKAKKESPLNIVHAKLNSSKKIPKDTSSTSMQLGVGDFEKNKNKILQWLHNTKNAFDRQSQTQRSFVDLTTTQDFDMPSVSQIASKEKLKKIPNVVDLTSAQESSTSRFAPDKKLKNLPEKTVLSRIRTRSFDNLKESELKLKRHSLESSSPSKIKQYQQANSIEDQLVMKMKREDKILDKLEEMILEKKVDNNATQDDQKENNENIINKGSIKILTSKEVDVEKQNSVKVKNKKSWRGLNKLKKNVGKSYAKKLDISLQPSQKSNKKDLISSHLDNSISTITETLPPKNTSITAKNKTVDFQKMEDYFTKVLPEMIEKSNLHSSSCEISEEKETKKYKDGIQMEISRHIPSKENESKNPARFVECVENSDDSNSDIYISNTQPLSRVLNKTEISSFIIKQLKKLNDLLNKPESVLDNATLDIIFPLIKNIIANIESRKSEEINCDNRTVLEDMNGQIHFSEKEIQTDLLSLDGFNITNTAFKTLIFEDVGIQTEAFCVSCPHLNHDNMPSISGVNTKTKDITMSDEDTVNYDPEKSKSNERSSNLQSFNDFNPNLSHGEKEQGRHQCDSTLSLTNESTKKKMKDDIGINASKEPEESEMPIEEIIRKCTSQNEHSNSNLSLSRNIDDIPKKELSNLNSSKRSNDSKIDRDEDAKMKSPINISQESHLLHTIDSSKPKVNRKLMFEALKNKMELEQTLKRVRSNSGSDEERPNKLVCNRFVRNDLSIQFETQASNCESRNPSSEKDNRNEVSEKSENLEVDNGRESNDCGNNGSEVFYTKTQNDSQKYVGTFSTEAMLIHCEEIIEKENLHYISSQKNNSIAQLSQKLVENIDKEISPCQQKQNSNKENDFLLKNNGNFRMETQDILKHCNDLIDREYQDIEIEKTSVENSNFSPKPIIIKTTSPREEPKIDVEMRTQDLLDHCNALIEKTTRNMDNENIVQSNTENDCQMDDDDFFSDKMEELENVLKKANESVEKRKGQIETANAKKIEILQNLTLKSCRETKMDTSDDEIFQDDEVIDATPQKQKHSTFYKRLGCSQLPSSKSQIFIGQFESASESNFEIVPPPPGFGDVDEEEVFEETNEIKQSSDLSLKESENVIPNSLSPKKSKMIVHKKPLSNINIDKKTLDKSQEREIQTLSQNFVGVSPIGPERRRDLNAIEIVQQSKFSPLTILPKASPSPSPLTSTPKQKSILGYLSSSAKLSHDNKSENSSSQFLEPRSLKPCIAHTRLASFEITSVLSLCNKKLAIRRDKFGPEVTHMIVSVDKHNRVKDHTMKFVSAIASGLWILSTKWIQECLVQNTIVDEEPYEVLDISGIPSPRISRLTRLSNPLFKGFKFYIAGPFSKTSEQDIEDAIKLLSGIVVSSVEDFRTRGDFICIVISDGSNSEDNIWWETYKVVTVDLSWLTLSICRYKVLSLKNYFSGSDESLEEFGYPPSLLEDVPSSLTQQYF